MGKLARFFGVLPPLAALLSGCAHEALKAPPAAPAAAARPVRIAVVLGAGAAKGFAHVGVLKVLESNKVPIGMVVGTSVGSFVGSLYAYGYDAYALQKLALAIEQGDIADFAIPDNGFLKGEKLEEFVNRSVRSTPIEKFRIPFLAVATDLVGGRETVFGRGNAGTAVRASCSIPGVFRPVAIGERVYVDGGVVSPVAVDAARAHGADVVIAVDISGGGERTAPQGTMQTILRSVDIMYGRIAAVQVAHADVVIRPNVGAIASGDFSKRHDAIMEGEKAASAAMPKIRELLEKLRREGRLP